MKLLFRSIPDLQSVLIGVIALFILYLIFNILHKKFIKESFFGKEFLFRIFLLVVVGIIIFIYFAFIK